MTNCLPLPSGHLEQEAARLRDRMNSGALADDELDMVYAAYNAILWALGYGCMPVSDWKQFKVRGDGELARPTEDGK